MCFVLLFTNFVLPGALGTDSFFHWESRTKCMILSLEYFLSHLLSNVFSIFSLGPSVYRSYMFRRLPAPIMKTGSTWLFSVKQK